MQERVAAPGRAAYLATRVGRNTHGHGEDSVRDRSLGSHERLMNAHLPPLADLVLNSLSSRVLRCRSGRQTRRDARHGAATLDMAPRRSTWRRDARYGAATLDMAPRRSIWRRDANQEAAAPRAQAVAHPAAYRRCDEHLHARWPRLLRRGHEPSLIQQRAGAALECVHQERAA